MKKSTKKVLVIAGVTVTLGAGGFIGYTLIKNKRIRAEQFRIFASDNDIIKALDEIKDGEKYKEFNKKYQVRLTDLSNAKSKRAFEEAGEVLNELLDEINDYLIDQENIEKATKEDESKKEEHKKDKKKKKKNKKAKTEEEKAAELQKEKELTDIWKYNENADNEEVTYLLRVANFLYEIFDDHEISDAINFIIKEGTKCPKSIENSVTENDYNIIGDTAFDTFVNEYEIDPEFIRQNKLVQLFIRLYLVNYAKEQEELKKMREEEPTEELVDEETFEEENEMEEEICEEDDDKEEVAATDDEENEENEISEEEEVEEENEEGECQNEVSNTTDEENEKDEGSEEGLIKDIGGVKVDFTADSDEDDEESEYVEKENLKDLLSKSVVEDEEDEDDNVKKNEKSVEKEEKEEEIVERPTKEDFEEYPRMAYFDMIKYRKDILNSTTYNIKERFAHFNDSIHILNTKEHYGYYHECLEVIFNILAMDEPEEHTLTRLDTFFKEFDKLVKPVIEKRIKDITTIAR